jgi:hypothetical protein
MRSVLTLHVPRRVSPGHLCLSCLGLCDRSAASFIRLLNDSAARLGNMATVQHERINYGSDWSPENSSQVHRNHFVSQAATQEQECLEGHEQSCDAVELMNFRAKICLWCSSAHLIPDFDSHQKVNRSQCHSEPADLRAPVRLYSSVWCCWIIGWMSRDEKFPSNSD